MNERLPRRPRAAALTLVTALALFLQASADSRGGTVNVNGHSMYYECEGHGRPTVVLDAGSPDPSSVWRWVQPTISRFTRVCAYDRAGIGRSAPAPARQHRTAQTQARELDRLLRKSQIPGPYIVVRHFWGGMLNREAIDIRATVTEAATVTSLDHLPLIVLGHGRPGLDARLLKAQDADADRSSNSIDAISHSTHYLQKPPPTVQPGVVIATVKAVLRVWRNGGHLPPCQELFPPDAVICRR